jgi:ABC-2 type transport system ATP-binding protein
MTAPDAPVIEAAGLRKAYGARTVVDNVSFRVQPGEIFGIVGPNGAGKTTTVEIVEGLRRADAGSVRILGLDPAAHAPQLRELVGVQLQQTQLPENLTVGEAVELFASFYRHPADGDALIADWGLAAHRTVRFGRLSGGLQQRLFIALALVGSPRIVFLDELTTGLDPLARRTTWELVRRIRDTGVTVVLVSHLMDEVENLCDRVIFLDRGAVVAAGSPGELITRVNGRTLDDVFIALQTARHPHPDPERSNP